MRVVVFEPGRLPVGIVRWHGRRARLSVIVKATFDFPREMDGLLTLAEEQEPLSTGTLVEGGTAQVAYPNDFVPLKAAADVIVTGSAHTTPAKARIDAAVRIGEWARSFSVSAGRAEEAIPLTAPYLWIPDEESAAASETRRVATPDQDFFHAEDFDYGHFNAAPAAQRLPEIPFDATIELFSLSTRATKRTLGLPGLRPTVYVEHDDNRVERHDPIIDTLWIDVEGERCVVVFREDFLVVSARVPDVDRILIGVALREIEREELLPLLPRVAPRFGVEATEPRAEAVDEDEADELMMARYATWSEAPAPTMPFEKYAGVSAELAEKREPREALLRRHGLDEDTWTLEERAWLGELARGAVQHEGAAEDFGERYLAAQDAAAGPEEASWTLADYAELTGSLEQATDIHKVLARRGLTMGAYQRIDRRWTKAMRDDPAIAEAYEKHLDAARGRVVADAESEEPGA
ncbi:MAG: DUF2169 domain-containing protein [Byssovorax sp.]